MRWGVLVAVLACACAFASPALADDWLPHNPDATWTYQWTDSVYSQTPTTEKVTVKSSKGSAFTLGWTTKDQGNAADAVTSTGSMSFQETTSGIDVVAPYWTSDTPPSSFPFLCATLGPCPNSLASTLYNVIWGSIGPVLPEPLVKGTQWAGTGVDASIQSTSRYVGTEQVTVPAFAQPVLAAKVQTDATQAGAIGDPYGSGVKTVWWVYGVGPVKVVFQHNGGPVTTSVLTTTNLTPKAPPSDVNWFPLQKNLAGTYSWTNSKHLRKASVVRMKIDQVANGSARLNVRCARGPIKCAGLYFLTERTDGLSSISSVVQAASLAKLPKLARNRHFFTPFDLMVFGANPILSEYAKAGDTWSVDPAGRDFAVFGARATSTVLGVQKVRVSAGTFEAIAVRTKLTQAGSRFGSGTRTTWFAPGRGLVKLVFSHGDGSTSVVQLTK